MRADLLSIQPREDRKDTACCACMCVCVHACVRVCVLFLFYGKCQPPSTAQFAWTNNGTFEEDPTQRCQKACLPQMVRQTGTLSLSHTHSHTHTHTHTQILSQT